MIRGVNAICRVRETHHSAAGRQNESGAFHATYWTQSAAEAAVVEDIEIIPIASLTQAVGYLSGDFEIEPAPSRVDELFHELSTYDDDFSDVRGQEMAKRALAVAAAGGHNVLML